MDISPDGKHIIVVGKIGSTGSAFYSMIMAIPGQTNLQTLPVQMRVRQFLMMGK
jgi:hypothetical protein